jgi:hypothetical protein
LLGLFFWLIHLFPEDQRFDATEESLPKEGVSVQVSVAVILSKAKNLQLQIGEGWGMRKKDSSSARRPPLNDIEMTASSE